MFILTMLIVTLIVVYIDALVCLSAKHKYNWKASVLSAIFWPITVPIVVVSIVKETRKY